jgi:hypothetical protein
VTYPRVREFRAIAAVTSTLFTLHKAACTVAWRKANTYVIWPTRQGDLLAIADRRSSMADPRDTAPILTPTICSPLYRLGRGLDCQGLTQKGRHGRPLWPHVWMAPAWQEKTKRAAQKSLAVMCPACSRSPDGLLALMESANRGLITRAGSMSQ